MSDAFSLDGLDDYGPLAERDGGITVRRDDDGMIASVCEPCSITYIGPAVNHE